MKVLAIAAASLITLVSAVPNPSCQPGTYSCTPNNAGWQTCDVNGKWVYSGACPPDTVCKFYPPSKSPYCVPPNFQFP